jgi:hypothetical protein
VVGSGVVNDSTQVSTDYEATFLRLPATDGRALAAGADDLERRVVRATESLDIGGTWQALHFGLTGDPWEGEGPLTEVVLGGQPLELSDAAMAFVVLAERVPEVADALAAADLLAVVARIDSTALGMVGVQDFELVEDETSRGDVIGGVAEAASALFAAAAAAGEAVVVVIE